MGEGQGGARHLHPLARRELARALARYRRTYPGREARFAAALARTLLRVEGVPQSFPATEDDARAAPVRRFPYRVVFTVEPGGIFVVALAHVRRRPGYWSRR